MLLMVMLRCHMSAASIRPTTRCLLPPVRPQGRQSGIEWGVIRHNPDAVSRPIRHVCTMLWQQLLLATIAGALLNLTPCVLPALPIKLRSIGRIVGQRTGHRLLAGLALLAGTLTFFGGLGIVTATLNCTWGTLFQSWLFRLALALLLATLGIINLCGRGMQPPQWAWRLHGNGYAEPFFVGLLAALLSTPCTGPFLGGVLVFALTQSPST